MICTLKTIYGYYIDPGWDEIGSETLYVKNFVLQIMNKVTWYWNL